MAVTNEPVVLGMPVQSILVNCWQSFSVSAPFGTHDHIFILYRLLRVLKRGLLFDERALNSTGHSPSTGEWLCCLSLSLNHLLTLCTGWLFSLSGQNLYGDRYIFIHSFMALQTFVGPWPLFQFRNIFFTQTVGLLGRGSARRKATTYTEDNINTE
jgi:hypothetical protein